MNRAQFVDFKNNTQRVIRGRRVYAAFRIAAFAATAVTAYAFPLIGSVIAFGLVTNEVSLYLQNTKFEQHKFAIGAKSNYPGYNGRAAEAAYLMNSFSSLKKESRKDCRVGQMLGALAIGLTLGVNAILMKDKVYDDCRLANRPDCMQFVANPINVLLSNPFASPK